MSSSHEYVFDTFERRFVELSDHVETPEFSSALLGDHHWPRHFADSLRFIYKSHGALAGLATWIGLLLCCLVTLAICFFCVEGSVRSLLDIICPPDASREGIVRIRPLGDIGGWLSISIFCVLACGDIIGRVVREGDYQKCVLLSSSVLSAWPEQSPSLYYDLLSVLRTLAQRSLVSRTECELRVTALRCLPLDLPPPCLPSDWSIRDSLVRVFACVACDCAHRRQLHRASLGWAGHREKGFSRCAVVIILGMVVPGILLLNALLSVAGDVGLAVELFVRREELTDVGHFGEWIFNAIESTAAAYFLVYVLLVREGDFVAIRRAYTEEMHLLMDSPSKLLLKQVAHDDLQTVSSFCNFFKRPCDCIVD